MAPPRGTYVYPFTPFVDFDFLYWFPYGVYPYSRYGYLYSPYRFVFPPPGCVTTEIEAHGTLRLDVPQRDAIVFVDGFYVGVVDDFDGETEAGRTITYRTPLQPAGSPATARP